MVVLKIHCPASSVDCSQHPHVFPALLACFPKAHVNLPIVKGLISAQHYYPPLNILNVHHHPVSSADYSQDRHVLPQLPTSPLKILVAAGSHCLFWVSYNCFAWLGLVTQKNLNSYVTTLTSL